MGTSYSTMHAFVFQYWEGSLDIILHIVQRLFFVLYQLAFYEMSFEQFCDLQLLFHFSVWSCQSGESEDGWKLASSGSEAFLRNSWDCQSWLVIEDGTLPSVLAGCESQREGGSAIFQRKCCGFLAFWWSDRRQSFAKWLLMLSWNFPRLPFFSIALTVNMYWLHFHFMLPSSSAANRNVLPFRLLRDQSVDESKKWRNFKAQAYLAISLMRVSAYDAYLRMHVSHTFPGETICIWNFAFCNLPVSCQFWNVLWRSMWEILRYTFLNK